MPSYLGYKHRDQEKLEKRRIYAVARRLRGESASSIARSLGVCTQSVQRWLRYYHIHGWKGLHRHPKSGSRPKVSWKKLASLPVLLGNGPEGHKFDTPIWTAERIAIVINRRFGVQYTREHTVKLLRRLGWRWHVHTWLPPSE